MKRNYYANISFDKKLKQTLIDHVYYVTMRSLVELEITKETNGVGELYNEERIKSYLVFISLLHDIGKVSDAFQNYLANASSPDKESKEYKGPMHNEISYLMLIGLMDVMLRKNDGEPFLKYFVGTNSDGKDTIDPHIKWGVYWHHKANYDEAKEDFNFNTIGSILNGWIKEEVGTKKKDQINLFLKNKYEDVIEVTSQVIDRICNSNLEYKTKPLVDKKLKLTLLSFSEYLKNMDLRDIDFNRLAKVFDEDTWNKDSGLPYYKIDYGSLRKVTAVDDVALNLSLMAHFHQSDSYISSLGVIVSEELLVTNDIMEPKVFEYDKNFKESKYSQKMISLAEEIAKSDSIINIVAMDAGAGKTIESLLVLNELRKTGYKGSMVITLPQTSQVEKMYQEMTNIRQNDKSDPNEVERVFGENVLNIQSFYSGGVKGANNGNKELYENSDVTISIIDRIASSSYDRKRNSELISLIRGLLVMDEYHKISTLSGMAYSLREIISIKKIFGGKVLLLSGTPSKSADNLLDTGKVSVRRRNLIKSFPREALPERLDKRKYSIKLIEIPEDGEFPLIENFPKESTVFYGGSREKTRKLWNMYANKEKDVWVSSSIESSKKDEVISKVLKDFGRGSRIGAGITPDYNVFHPKILSTSYNISFDNLVLVLVNLDDFKQQLARVGRFSNGNYNVYVYYKKFEKEKILGRERNIDEVHASVVLSETLESNNKSSFGYRELMDLMDKTESELDEFILKYNNRSKTKLSYVSKTTEHNNELYNNFPKRSTNKDLPKIGTVSESDYDFSLEKVYYKNTLRDRSVSILIDGMLMTESLAYLSSSKDLEDLNNYVRVKSNTYYFNEFFEKYCSDIDPEVAEYLREIRRHYKKKDSAKEKRFRLHLSRLIGATKQTPIVISEYYLRCFGLNNLEYVIEDGRHLGLFLKK